MNEETDAAAARTAIDAQFTAPRATDFAGAATKTTDHIIVAAYRRFVDDRLGSGEVTILGGRLLTRYVAKTESNLNVLRIRTRAAIEDQILSGVGPFTFETADPPEPDGDWYSAADIWTY